jgi:enoyl-CoA hydratase
LIEEVVPAEQLDAAVERLLDSILTSGPRAIRSQKALITAWEELPLHQAVQRGIDSFAMAWESDEPRRMMQDFLVRRRERKLAAGRTEKPE